MFFFQLINFIVSNSLVPDQDRCIVGPDLSPNCLQRLAAEGPRRQRLELTLHTFQP